MILLPKFNNSSVAVFGLGQTGLSIINSLLASNCKVFAWDDKLDSIENARKLYPSCVYISPNNYDWKSLSNLILSPGIKSFYSENKHWIIKIANKNNCSIISDIELFYSTQKSKFICVTGTNGKSTTSALIQHILTCANFNSSIGGNFGRPVLTLEPNKDIYVLELSSYQISLLKNFKADIAVLLNITPDHIDFHGNMNNYISSKKKIVQNADLAIVGCNNEITTKIYNSISGNKISFSLKNNLIVKENSSEIYLSLNNKKIKIQEMKINPISSFENIAASCLIANYLNIQEDLIIQSLQSFPGLKHRNELLGKLMNVMFVNDSKATNASSTEKALSYYRNIYWIVGGRRKYGGISTLTKYFSRVHKAFLIGETTEEFSLICKKNNLNFMKCYHLENAVQEAYKAARQKAEESVILLSPSCSSLDQWENFEKRGENFEQLFKMIKKGELKNYK